MSSFGFSPGMTGCAKTALPPAPVAPSFANASNAAFFRRPLVEAALSTHV